LLTIDFLYGSNMSTATGTMGIAETILVGGGGRKPPAQDNRAAGANSTGKSASILGKVGVEQKTFGDSTGTIAGV
jgi:hypothetical protein